MQNVKQTTEPSTLNVSATSTIAGTTNLVTETTGKVTQHVNFQLSLRYIYYRTIQYTQCENKIT